jgi:glucosamine-6-phosphate deaminase
MTILQNSLHGCFGCSGDIASVPPRAATIGPADVKRARNRMETHALSTMGTFSSWQRMISRLILHGEVTPLVPASILQLMDTNVFVSEEIAKPIECLEKVGY